MKMQISELAKHFNVSVRTLQYYDNMGILKPTEVTEKGYRFYDESSVSTMEKILQYKQFGFSLDSISKLLSEEDPEKSGLRRELLLQKRKYEQEIKRLNSVINDIDRELAKPVKFNNWFDKIMKDYNHSRCTYSTFHGEEFVAWGKADYENDIDFTTSLRFPIGSLTTQFTAYCIIRFQELGLLRTDDPVGKYFPEMIYGDNVTIQHLLNMTSGFTNEFFDKKWADEDWNEYCKKIGDLPYELQICRSYEYTCNYNKENSIIQSVSEIIEAANFAPLKFTPGEKFDWAEINYLILRIILEKISQKSLKEIMNEYIFTPLEMDNTTLYGSTDVVGYVDNMRIEYYDSIYGGVYNVISTIDDMTKWYNFLIKEDFMARYIPADAEFSCGWFNNEDNYRLLSRPCEVDIEVSIDKDKDKDKYSNLFISVMNKRPIPDNHTRIMYYPIECDDGYFKVEVWEMFPNSEITVTSIKVFDENAEELYSAKVPECGYFFTLRNDGEKRNAEEFAEAGSYNYEINLSEILGSEFKPMGKYIAEVRAECTEYSIFGRSAMLGMVYKRKDEWISVAYYAFYCYDSAYDIFMEALNRVVNFWNDKFYNYLDEPENEDENENK